MPIVNSRKVSFRDRLDYVAKHFTCTFKQTNKTVPGWPQMPVISGWSWYYRLQPVVVLIVVLVVIIVIVLRVVIEVVFALLFDPKRKGGGGGLSKNVRSSSSGSPACLLFVRAGLSIARTAPSAVSS